MPSPTSNGAALHMPRQKDVAIHSLRGLALIFMVAGHVIGATADRGMNVSDESGWRLFYVLLEDIRMPLFTLLSGAVYAHRPVMPGRYGGLVKGKARRLLVPMITVGVLFFFVQLVTPGTNSKPEIGNLWRIFFFGYEHLWFAQAIFLIFLVVGALGLAGLLDSFGKWAAVTGVSCVLFLLVDAPTAAGVFSSAGAAQLLPFFLLGYGVTTYRQRIITPGTTAVLAAGLAVMLTLKVFAVPMGAAPHGLSLALGVTGTMTLIALKDRLCWRPLAWLGQFSFAVYLLHVFGAAGTRLILGRLGIEGDALVFVLCLTVGIAAPVAFELICGRFALISWGLLGQKPRTSSKARPGLSVTSEETTSTPR